MSSQRWITRVTVKPAANSRAAIRIDEREIVTSPTLKPKNTARSEPIRSVDSMPQGASTSRIAMMMSASRADAARQNADLLQGAAAQARIGLQRRGDPALAAQGAADELVGERDGQDQQGDDDRDPDRLIDQEGRQRHIAAEHAADDDGDDEPAEGAQGAADVDLRRHIGAEAGLVLGRPGGEAAQQLGEDERRGEREDRPGR